MDGSDERRGARRRRPEAAPAGPGRVCVLAVERPYVHRQGSSSYLDHLARSLATVGAEVHLRILQPPGRDQLRVRLEPEFLAPYASVGLFGAVRRGAAFYARDPRCWLGPLRRRRAPSGPWSLLRPEPAAAAWAAAEVEGLAPDWVVANYVNAAEAFDRLPPRSSGGVAKAILLHDVFALRAEALRAIGEPLDFDEGLVAREAQAFRAADLVLAIKPEEAAHVAALAPGVAVATLPFAVEIPDVDLEAPRPPVALFVGALNRPNVDALGWLLAEIWPRVRRARPEARLRVVGRVAASFAGPWPEGAEPVGFVEDLGPEYAGAAAVLAPIRFGSGVKIKLVEGLAHGLPAVATPAGAEGLGPLPPAALRLAEDAQGFAAALAATLADPEPAAARAAARAAVEGAYARDAVARRLAADLARARAARA
jgi:glycosyltransferase involved in cell wall biosynthesis